TTCALRPRAAARRAAFASAHARKAGAGPTGSSSGGPNVAAAPPAADSPAQPKKAGTTATISSHAASAAAEPRRGRAWTPCRPPVYPSPMPTTHVVRAGEHLPGIAHQYGFYDYLAVWDHPENAGLKKQRKDPMVLAPDDRVYIPDKIPKQVSGGTGRSFRFVIKRTKLKLRLVVCGWDRKPLGGADVTLTGSGPELDMAPRPDGPVEQALAAAPAPPEAPGA